MASTALGCAHYAAIAFSLLACGQPREIRQIRVVSETGPWNARTSSLVVTETATGYSAGARQIPSAVVQDLCGAIFASPVARPDLRSLGLSPQWLDEVAKGALVAFEKQHSVRLTAHEQQLFTSSFHDRQLVQQSIETALLTHTDDHPKILVEVRFRSGKLLTLSSRSQYAFMLPWTIEGDGKHALTYDPHIALAVAKIIPAGFTNSERLTDEKLRSDVAYFVTKHSERLLRTQ